MLDEHENPPGPAISATFAINSEQYSWRCDMPSESGPLLSRSSSSHLLNPCPSPALAAIGSRNDGDGEDASIYPA